MWNCCVAWNELHQRSVSGTSDVTPRKDYGQSQMKDRRANSVFTQWWEMRGEHTTRFITQKFMKMKAETFSETSEPNISPYVVPIRPSPERDRLRNTEHIFLKICALTQRIFVIPYRRFGTIYQSHLQGDKTNKIEFLDVVDNLSHNVVKELPPYTP